MTAGAALERDARETPLRICIVTPGQLGSNPRVVKEADLLQAAGHRVTVVSTRILDAVEPRDQAVLRAARWTSRRIDLRAKIPWKARRLAQTLSGAIFAATGNPRAAVLAHSAITPALTGVAMAVAAELYIAHYPAALPAAAAAARRHGARYAFDAEDFHLGDRPEHPAQAKATKLVREIESHHLPRCAYVTAASPGIAEAYADAYACARPHVVLNAFPLEQAPPRLTERGGFEGGPSLYWFSQTIGPDRGLECAVSAIAVAESRPHLCLRGTAAPNYADELAGLARGLGVADRLHLMPPDAPDRMEALAAHHDLGLCGEPGHTRNNALALSNKLFSYLLAGVAPVLSDTPAHRTFAVEAGLRDHVFPIDDHAALARLLDRFLGDPERLAAARATAWRLGQDRYNWEYEGRALLALVEQTCRV